MSSVPPTCASAVLAAAGALPFGVAIADTRGGVTWANAAYAQLERRTSDELLGHSAGEFDWDELAHTSPSSEPWRCHTTCTRKTGEIVCVECSITALRDPEAVVTGFWIMKREIAGLNRRPGRPYDPQANLSALIESTEDLIGSVDLEYRLLTFNKAFRDSIKWSVGIDATEGMGPEKWLPPERAALWPPMFERALAQGSFRTEYSLLDGRTLELSFNPIRQNGQAVGISIFGKDISERRRAEDALREAEREYRGIFEGAVEGMFRTSIEGKSLAANPALAKMLGYDSAAEGLPAVTDSAHQVWLDADARADFLRTLRDQGAVLGYECQFKRRDGTALWVSLNGRIVSDTEGRALYIEGFVTNITERKRGEETVRQAHAVVAKAEANLSALIESTDDLIWSVDCDFRLLTFNTALRRHIQNAFGIRAEVGLGPDDLMPPERAVLWPPLYERAFSEGAFRSELPLSDGRTLELSFSPIRQDGRVVAVSVFGKDVTERKQAERAIRQAESQYRSLFEDALEGIYRTSAEKRQFLAANPALARMLGYDSAQELISTINDTKEQLWYQPDDRERLAVLLEEHGSTRDFECRFKCKGGALIWVSINVRAVCDAFGKALYYDGFIQDITDRKQMQDALRKSEEKYAKAFLSSPALTAIFKPGPEGNRIIDVNEAFEQDTGYRREEVIGRLSQEIGRWGDTNEVDAAMRQFRTKGRVRNLELNLRRRNGENRIGLVSAVWVELDGEQCAVVTTIDITELREAEKRLRAQSERFQGIIEHTNAGYFRIGVDGCYQEVNPAWLRMSGFQSKEDAIGLHFSALQAPERLSEMAAAVDSLLAGMPHLNHEFPRRRRDGSIGYYTSSSNPVFEGGRVVGLEGFLLDVSERRRAEQDKELTEQRYRSLFDSMLEGAAIHRLVQSDGSPENYILLEVNHRYEEILGLKREDIVNQLATCAYGTADAPFLKEYANVVRSGIPVQFETYFGPMEKHFMISVASMGEDCFATIFFDITEQKKAQQAIEQANDAVAKAEAHYRLMFNNVSDAVFIHPLGADGMPGKFVEVNDNACRHLGYPREQLVRMGPDDIDAPEERAAIGAKMRGILADGHLMWEGTHVAKDGRRIPVEVNTHLVNLDGWPTIISSVRDISDRKASEKRYHEIFEGAAEGIYRTLPAGKLLVANPAFARMLGYDTPGELLSASAGIVRQMWLDPDERARCAAILEAEGRVEGFECQIRRKDGTVIWMSLNARKVRSADGGETYYDGFAKDITERNRMQEALRKSEEKFAKAFLSSPVIMMLVAVQNGGNRVMDVNDAFEKGTGYRREEVVGRITSDIGLWADDGAFAEAMKQLRVGGSLRSFEYQFRRRSGDIRSGLMSAEVLELDGQTCIIEATTDITEPKKVEEGMRSLATAIEQSAETIVITDLSGVIQYCNPAFERASGYSQGEAIGQNPRILKSGKHDGDFYRHLWATVTSGEVWTGTLTNKRKDGSFYEEAATISPIRDAAGHITGFVAAKRDVTKQHQLEDQLRQAQKLESVGRLAGGVAHDFNNLLTVINGYSALLLKKLTAHDPLHPYVMEIKNAGERAASLTKQLLAFSRKQVIEPRILDVNATIRESAPMLRRLIGEDIVLETHLDGSLGNVMADPGQIHQIIMNLSVNARDAMPDGGRLDIETVNVDLCCTDGVVAQHAATPGPYVLITVTDTGVGIDEEVREHIFEPFFTTKELGTGTGLGLSTVYGIVRQSGGWIDVWSAAGIGTSFMVYLPRLEPDTVPPVRSIASTVERGTETILLVEDQKAVRSFARTALKQHGYSVLEASDGDEAVVVARKFAGEIHLLLTDVVMPGVSGKESSERLLEARPNLKVLYMSGYTADVIAQRGVLDRGIAFLSKPFSPAELAKKVREVLDGSVER